MTIKITPKINQKTMRPLSRGGQEQIPDRSFFLVVWAHGREPVVGIGVIADGGRDGS